MASTSSELPVTAEFLETVSEAILDKIKTQDTDNVISFLNTLPQNVTRLLFSGPEVEADEVGPESPVDDPSRYSVRCLHVACEHGKPDIVCRLLSYGVNPRLATREDGTALEVACKHGRLKVIQKLVDYDSALWEDEDTVKDLLALACYAGHQNVAEYWLEVLTKLKDGEAPCAEDFVPNNDPLIRACQGKHYQLASYLVKKNVVIISSETAFRTGKESFSPLLELWCEQVNDETPGREERQGNCEAKWSNCNFSFFDEEWLTRSLQHILVKINLSRNGLAEIPQVLLWGLPFLESLDVSHNIITKLPSPKTIEMLENSRLTSFKASHNLLAFPILELFMSTALEILDLTKNHITSLDHARFPSKLFTPEGGDVVWKCQRMKVLNLSRNKILRIPALISSATSLEKLDVSDNRLTKLPAPWNCPLAHLNASKNKIMDVPDMHGHWNETLEILNMSSNKLMQVPWTFCQLTTLKVLNLASNLITKLPSEKDWSIYSLKSLILADNRLFFMEVSSPSSPAANKKRWALKPRAPKEAATGGVFHHSTPAEPAAVVFPEVFSDCLLELDLSKNQLQGVPPSLCNLTSLETLDLSGNKDISKLPDNLTQLTNLYFLKLDGLNIREPETVAALVERGSRTMTRDILDKLKEKMLDCKPQYCMKLMLVGPKKCGKTSVLYCLTEKRPENDLGINIDTWTLQKPVAKSKSSVKKLLLSAKSKQDRTSSQTAVQFSTWDLKGGEMNSTISQSFFTPRALYLLVLDLLDHSEGIEQLRPWLLNIQSRASESALIIVLTHLDMFNRNRLNEIKEEIFTSYRSCDGFPRIGGIIEVTATSPTAEGIRELRQLILREALDMTIKKKWPPFAASRVPLIGRMVPGTFTVLQEIVANENNRRKQRMPPQPPVLKEAELVSLIRKIPYSTIQTQRDIEEATEFLISCGSLLHFSDHLQGLTSLYFLDPVWLYNILISIVNAKSSIREGRIELESLKKLFETRDYGMSNFDEILQLLQRLEIVLPISDTEFLIPSRLPRDKPGQDHFFVSGQDAPFQTLERLYKMPYTPPGFWNRLVSRVYVFLKDINRGDGNRPSGDADSGNRIQRHSRMQSSMQVGLKLVPTNIMYWQQGVSVQHPNGHIQLEPVTFPDAKPGVCIRVHSKDGEFMPMGFLVDQIEKLIKEWYPGLLGVDDFNQPLVQRLIPCPVCKKRNVESEKLHHFSISDLGLATTTTGLKTVECPRHPEEVLALPTLIPDLLLEDLPVRMLNKAEFDFDPRHSQFLKRGGFGQVFRAKFRGEEVAVKMFINSSYFRSSSVRSSSTQSSSTHSSAEERTKSSSSGSDSPTSKLRVSDVQEVDAELVMRGFSNLRREVTIMSKLRHPCIIQLIGISIQYLCFAMELAPLGDLANLLNREYEIQRKSVRGKVYQTILERVLTYKIALQIACGVAYLHRKKIIHSDLKTDNVLLYSQAPDVPVNVKLTDYGIARSMGLQGARGQAGPMGFCAPEILRGRTFTEKVDWFSYGMLVYHLMAGVWPYDNLNTAIDVRDAVSVGEKPRFEFRDYSIVTLFPNLERLMTRCWSSNPDERPSGQEIVQKMEDASFKCLVNVIHLDIEPMTCLYAGSEEKSGRLWFWTGEADSRQSTKIHIKYFTKEELSPTPYEGAQANCMLQVGEWELVGTKDNRLQLYCPPAVGPQQNVFQQDFRLAAEALCLCYQPVKDERLLGYLFVGLVDGHVAIFKHSQAVSSDSGTLQKESDWSKFKVLTLENKRCNHLMLVPEREELWIACGNKLRFMNTKVMLLEPLAIVVTSNAARAIAGLAHHGDNLFCFSECSSKVLQYSMASGGLLQRFQCGNVLVVRGKCLVPECDEEDEEEKAENGEVLGAEAAAGTTSDASSPAEIAGHSTPLKSQCATLPSHPRVAFSPPHPFSAGYQPEPSGSTVREVRSVLVVKDTLWIGMSTGKTLVACIDAANRHGCSTVREVRSVLVVKDTLWIGMSTGETLVACIDAANRHGYKFGEVLAVLRLFPEFGDDSGPVRQLLMTREGHVVGVQELKSSAAFGVTVEHHRYQLLVWQAWGSQDIGNFEHIHHLLNEAETAVGN